MPSVQFLEAYADAWNRHVLDAIMAAMTADTDFIPSGDNRIERQTAVREAFADVFAPFPDVQFSEATHFVSGNRGLSGWVFSGTDEEDESRVEVLGCDVFTYDGDLIAVKNSYLKSPG